MTMMRDNNLDIPRASAPAQDIVPASPTTAWQIIEEACDARVTGEVTLTTESPVKTRVYMSNGLVYFAERDSDTSLATRLVEGGAIDAEQLKRGSVRLSGVEHLGRLFDRDPSIDRDAVEVVIELVTEDTLTEIAEQIVRSYRTAMFRHHPSGIARWFSSMQAAEESIPEPAPTVAPVRHMSAVPPFVESEPARTLAPVFDIVPQPVAPLEPAAAMVEPEVVHEPAPEIVDEIVPVAVRETEVVAQLPETPPTTVVAPSPAPAVTPSWSTNGGDDAVLQALNALDALQPMMPLRPLIPITPMPAPVAPVATAPSDPEAFDMTSLLQNLDAYGIHASPTANAPVAPIATAPVAAEIAPINVEPAPIHAAPVAEELVAEELVAEAPVADEPVVAMTHVDEHPFEAPTPIAVAEEVAAEEVAAEEVAAADEQVTFDQLTVGAPIDGEVVAELPSPEPVLDAEPVAELIAPWMQPIAPQIVVEDVTPVSPPTMWWQAPVAPDAAPTMDEPAMTEAVAAAASIEPTSAASLTETATAADSTPFDSATTDLFGSFRRLVASEPEGLDHFVVPQIEFTASEVEAEDEVVVESEAEVVAQAEVVEDEPEAVVEDEPEVVVEDEPEATAPVAAAHVPAPLMMPTLPTFSSPPNMRISAQAPPPRTLPSVMTNSRPELTLNADGPRLPSPSRPGQPEPVQHEPAQVEPTQPELVVASTQPLQTSASVTTATSETSDIDWVTELASTAQPIAAPVPLATEFEQLTQLASLTPAAAPAAFVPLDSPAPRFAGLTQLASIGDIATEARRAVESQPTAEIATHASPFAQLTAMTALSPMPSMPSPAFLDSPFPASGPTTTTPVPSNLGSIPVPEDVAAAVRRAITAIEAATLAPSGGSAIAFGPMHVTAPGQSGRPMTFDSLLNPAGVASGAAFDAMGMNTGQLQMGGTGSVNPLSEGPVPPQLLSNVPPAALSSERRGALRRLIDGIRRRN